MDAATLAKLCRCGHPRRFHQRGTIWHGYETTCLMTHHNGPEAHPDYRGGSCIYFEPVDGWQESYARALRDEGYLVQRPLPRDTAGRFLSRSVAAS